MKVRMFGMGVLVVLLAGAVAWAGHCIICYKQVPDAEKYCDFHKGAMLAQQANAAKEKELVDAVKKARADYDLALKKLRQFYYDSGNAERLFMASNELDDLKNARKYEYQGLEDTVGDLVPAKDIPEATKLYERADSLRRQVLPPWGSEKRLREALRLYMELIEKYPDSKLVDEAAFGIGDILEGADFREYGRAVRWYERGYQWNPATKRPARYRAARLYEERLGDNEKAAQLYYLVAETASDLILKQEARVHLEQLQNRGFGRQYLEEPPKKSEKEKKEPAK